MTSNIRIFARELQPFVRDIFIKAGLPHAWAEAEAEILVWADLRGVGSHGVLRVPSYLAGIPRGMRRPDADIRLIQDRGCMGVMEGDRGPGLYTTRLAMELAIEKARQHAIGMVWVRQTTHTGAMGYYARQAAESGLIGITFCSSRPLMAYFGTRDAALGTAPLSIGVPRAGGSPIVFDMASAATTIGAMAQAEASGKALPAGVAMDSAGRVTTDPRRAVTPLPAAGPKGSGLGFMIECLTSLLAGLPLLASAMENPALRHEYLQNPLCIAIDPAAFDLAGHYAAEVDRLACGIAAAPRAEGFGEILMPGERGDREAQRRAELGIELPEAVWAQLVAEGRKRGVSAPASKG